MAATGIATVKIPHDAVLDELLAHPFYTLRQLSMATGYSISWLSQMIRSDCFQQEYRRRRGDIEVGIFGTVQDRLAGLSHLAIDRMEEILVKNEDPELVVDAFDKVLHRTGYAPKAQPVAPQVLQQQNNFFAVDREELAGLRQGMLAGTLPPLAIPAELPDQDDAP